jgi:solute carrier family 35, member F5
VVLVSLSDSSEVLNTTPSSGDSPINGALGRAPIVGDSLALLSAFVYAMYVTFLKVRVRAESRVDMQLFFGFVGLFNIFACLPVGILLHIIHVERLIIPSSKRVIAGILVNVSVPLH